MNQEYPVTVSGKQVGKVLVECRGLYYQFSCRCNLSGNIIYRLMVSCGSVCESLGILIPLEGSFGIETKLPIKRLGIGKLVFSLIPRHEASANIFIPIYPDEPFAYISRLKKSFLVLQNGQPGISIVQMQE